MLLRLFLSLSMALSLPFCRGSFNEQKHFDIYPAQKQIVRMDPTNLDFLFFRSAIFALFKAKADTILRSLPHSERIVYGQCETDSNGRLNLLAKCLVSLFNIRDFRANSNKNLSDYGLKFTEVPWISAISRKIFEVKTENRAEKAESMAKFKSHKLKKNMAKLGEILGRRKGAKGAQKHEKMMREIGKRRPKREGGQFEEERPTSAAELMEHGVKQYPHVQKMIRVERFYRLLDKCNEYIRRKDEDNSRMLQLSGLPFQLQTKSVERNALLGVMKMQLRQSADNDKLSILSPKLFSLIPDRSNHQLSLLSTVRPDWARLNSSLEGTLLSPTLFSFLDQGNLSLPSLLKLGLSNNETIAWLDLLLRISGASATLDKLILSMGPAFEAVERRIHPAIDRLEEMEKRFRRLRTTESEDQRQEMASRGYTFISEWQSRVVLGEAVTGEEEGDGEDMERLLEQDIRTIARLNSGDNDGLAGHGSGEDQLARQRRKRFLRTEPFGQLRLLNPYLFANQLHDGAVLRRVALSPRAFSSSVMSPEFGQLEVLSPRAFLATILSPRAAIANILSPSAFTLRVLSPQAFLAEVINPKAFTARVLSPRAMSAFVLSPRALITTILSPKMLELRILSPTTLAFTVLSPTIGGAKVASGQSLSMVVLSPNILSPSFLNKGTGNLRILSPSILSGGGGAGEK